MALVKDQHAYYYDTDDFPRVEAARRGRRPPGASWRGVAPSNQLCFVLKGSIESEINGKPFLAKAGRLYFSGAGDICTQQTSEGCETYYVLFSWDKRPGSHKGKVWPLGSPHEIILTAKARKRLSQTFSDLVAVFAEGQPGWEVASAGYLLVILSILTCEQGSLSRVANKHAPGAIDKRTAQALDFMRRNMHRTFKIAEVASEVGVTTDYLFGLFKQRLGVSPLQYLIQLRVQEARRLMALDSTISAKEACRRAGVGNPQHFTRLFRRLYGISPSEFQRKQHFARERKRAKGRE